MSLQPVILCIEDEGDLRAELADELSAAGYTVLTAADGVAALHILARQTPHLILCDVMMPGLSGLDLIARIRNLRPALASVPVLMLTALADRQDELAGRLAGADDYLTKPIDLDLLQTAIRNKIALVERIRAGAALPPDMEALVHLTPRETEVLRALGMGGRIRDIAAKLGISEYTVSDYVKAIYAKLGISSRAEATREALRRHLITLGDEDETG
ncbi:response regulator transcription factor [Rhizobiaceae bacterium BDR2-2]|uniref:Response regulator transcription factor n=1 Tax=Ectorhizobium quercum TaxID=2965071 RepID=A0AAE3N438_9HYPH|nr:response regulator transcription factor [Ectorhizobium quercum]MCX8998147.1 response regulator transcription factor [Ectorhizobium quercum]